MCVFVLLFYVHQKEQVVRLSHTVQHWQAGRKCLTRRVMLYYCCAVFLLGTLKIEFARIHPDRQHVNQSVSHLIRKLFVHMKSTLIWKPPPHPHALTSQEESCEFVFAQSSWDAKERAALTPTLPAITDHFLLNNFCFWVTTLIKIYKSSCIYSRAVPFPPVLFCTSFYIMPLWLISSPHPWPPLWGN